MSAVLASLSSLVGGTIDGVATHTEDGQEWPVLYVRMPDGDLLAALVACDPEVNGPGHLVITSGEA